MQAQGGGVEESVVLVKQESITGTEALQGLNELQTKLSRPEQRARTQAFADAEKWINQVITAGGTMPTSRSFYQRTKKHNDIRVDVEVKVGFNLVPE